MSNLIPNPKFQISNLKFGFVVALTLVLLTAGIVFGKDSLKSVYQDLIDTQDRVLSRAVSGIENGEKEEVVKEEVPVEISEKEIEELRAEIKKLKEVGIQVKETIKEITKITQVEPVKEITKEVIKIDDKELAKIKTQLAQFAAWGADIENLRAITQKLQANPAQTPVATAPIYIGSQGIQVGGTGQFASLGVSGSAGIGSLGVGGSASIGSTASDKLTVAATSEFNAPVFAKAGLTVGRGTLNIDEKGNLITKGTVRMAGFQLGTIATAGHVLTTDASGVGTWQPAAAAGVTWPLLSTIDGTVLAPAYSWGADTNMGIRRGGSGNLRFVTAGTDRLTIDSAGNVGIGTDTPNNRLQVAGLINFNDLIRGTFLGFQAGNVNTGGNNTFIGFNAGFANTTGFNNIFTGVDAGSSNTTGSDNIFTGVQAGFSNTIGSNNIFTGRDAGFSNTEGFGNIFTGVNAGNSNTTGNYNTFIGMNAGFSNTTGSDNIFIGRDAGSSNTTGFNNIFTGVHAGFSNTIGHSNTFTGWEAGFSNTTGNFNTFVGATAGHSNTTGFSNTFIGVETGFSNTTGHNNTFTGLVAGHSNTTGSFNTFTGMQAGFINTTGSNNTFTGTDSGYFNSTGNNNTFTGMSAGRANSIGFNNTFIGTNAGSNNTVGHNNTFTGVNAGRFLVDGMTRNEISNNSVFIGNETRASAAGNTNEIVIGANAIGSGSNSITLGNIDIIRTILRGNVGIGMTDPGTRRLAVVATGAGAHPIASAWDIYSDIVRKENIRDIHYGLKEVLLLQPRSFNTKVGPSTSIGFIAQEIEKVIPEVVSGEAGQKGISYANLTALLTKAIQEQQKQIEELKLQLNQNGDLLQNGQEVNSQFVNSQSNNSLIETIKQVLASLGLVIENGITKVKELFAEKIFTKTARVEKLEMVDKATGEIFCTWIENGEWQKVKSSCDDLATVQNSTLNSGEPAPTGVSD